MYGLFSTIKSHFIGYLANGPTTINYFASSNPAVETAVMVDGKPQGRVNVTERLGRRLWWTVDTNGQVHVDLVRVTLGTQTGDDDRDHDTGLFVQAVDRNNHNIAEMINGETGGQYGYADHEYHLIDVPIIGHPEKSQCDGFQYRVGIQAKGGLLGNAIFVLGGNYKKGPHGEDEGWDGKSGWPIATSGNDDWKFSSTLSLFFSDGTIEWAYKDRQELRSAEGKLAWGDYSGATGSPVFEAISSPGEEQSWGPH